MDGADEAETEVGFEVGDVLFSRCRDKGDAVAGCIDEYGARGSGML